MCLNIVIIDESHSNKGAVAFRPFVGVISHARAIAIFLINIIRKSNFKIIFFINFFDHNYKLSNFFYSIEIFPMIVGTCMDDQYVWFRTDSWFDVIE